jgi:mannose-1-phosphate guanylyltransferase
MSMQRFVVIMAGGSGERFWPSSRVLRPKQLLNLVTSDRSMIEEAIERLTPLVPLENILIITSHVLQEPIQRALPQLPALNVIAEPSKRNTAPCLALACSVIQRKVDGDALMTVVTADHFIGNATAFRADVERALQYAEAHDALVTIGVPPTRPETGYGYIQAGDDLGGVRRVASFTEKPSREVALEYIADGSFLWNSGMFFWRTSALESAMKQHLPVVGLQIAPMTEAIRRAEIHTVMNIFDAFPDISIDFGVMERAQNVVVVPASFPWDDVGSWDALDRMHQRDASDNVLQGDVLVTETSNSIVVNEHDTEHVVTVMGMEDMVVVVTQDATLVCPKDRAQDVKKVVAMLRERGRAERL